jgi:hypothetical protein
MRRICAWEQELRTVLHGSTVGDGHAARLSDRVLKPLHICPTVPACHQDSLIRQQLIERLMRRIMQWSRPPQPVLTRCTDDGSGRVEYGDPRPWRIGHPIAGANKDRSLCYRP